MSQKNIQVIEAVMAAWNAGDMDALGRLYDPNVVMRGLEGWPESGPFVGRDSVVDQYKQLRDVWEADQVEQVGKLVGVGDRVVFRHIWHTVGRGLNSSLEATTVYTMCDGKITYQVYFRDYAEALKIVGLEQED